MQGTLPLDLFKLDSRLQELLDLLESEKSPTVANTVKQFVTDYSHDEGGPCALFHENCRATWQREGEFYYTHITRCDELSKGRLTGRVPGRDRLGAVCAAMLQFLEDSKCPVDWQENSERLRKALRRYLSFRTHGVKETSPAAEPERNEGDGGAKEGDTADATAATAKAPWSHSHDEQRPARFCYGPLTDAACNLDAAIHNRQEPDTHFRQLKNDGQEGRLWIVPLSRFRLQVWFTDTDKNSYTTFTSRLERLRAEKKPVTKKRRSKAAGKGE